MSVAAVMDDVDPISEADLFLNFGRDVQAEEILKDALNKTPANAQIKLKLLSIYLARKDVKTFSKYAQEIKDSGDAGAWERASVMGREIDPGNTNYGDAKGEVRNRERPQPEVDFDLGLGKPAAAAATDFSMDFDLTAKQPSMSEQSIDVSSPFSQPTAPAKPAKTTADVDATSILSRSVVQAAEAASPMDFDVSGILPGDVKKIAESTAMDFDLSGTNLDLPQTNSSSSMMDFDLSGSNLEIPPAPQKSSPAADSMAMNFNDLVFEIPGSEPKAAEVKPAAPADDGLAFTVDFHTGSTVDTSAPKADTSSKLDIDFGSININFDEAPAAQSGGDSPGGDGKDEHWHEVATKLDLAKAYQEMGDADGAREILEEVLRDGDQTQRDSAQKLLQQITA
jgi:pilus assembly protein FimV